MSRRTAVGAGRALLITGQFAQGIRVGRTDGTGGRSDRPSGGPGLIFRVRFFPIKSKPVFHIPLSFSVL